MLLLLVLKLIIQFLIWSRVWAFDSCLPRKACVSFLRKLTQKSTENSGEWEQPADWENSSNSWQVSQNLNPEDAIAEIAKVAKEEIAFLQTEEKKDLRIVGMKTRGLSDEAIKAYTGREIVIEEKNEALEKFNKATSSGNSAFGMFIKNIDYTKSMSHEHVEVDKASNEPLYQERFVYVDEYTCIGCTNCACVASNTFFMEDDYGRARVFLQSGDDEETIKIAVETCPVDCIHYVPFTELKKLEKERSEIKEVNFKARLVGGDGSSLSRNKGGAQVISGNSGYRCNNCPSRGCANCPMYGVGENPAFIEKNKKKVAAKKKRLEEQRREQTSKRFEL